MRGDVCIDVRVDVFAGMLLLQLAFHATYQLWHAVIAASIPCDYYFIIIIIIIAASIPCNLR